MRITITMITRSNTNSTRNKTDIVIPKVSGIDTKESNCNDKNTFT